MRNEGDISCDIFCTVIDNLGDAGVCWRLARQLAAEFEWRVRLWIDDPVPIALLAPDRAEQPVEIRQWAGNLAGIAPANVVIEAFACALPPRYIESMATRPKPPVWLNLEYLSAEDWVPGCHGLPSPQAGLAKHFFFPGFVTGTGGLIREKHYAIPPTPIFDGPLQVSLFCYANTALPALLANWRDGALPIVCHVADGLPRHQVAAWLGETFLPGSVAQHGKLRLEALPFLPQTGYDARLAACHLNFVRGEDSLIRAQWAERPCVWQAYPQADKAHLVKLAALLNHYCIGLDSKAASATHTFWQAWNGHGDIAATWPAFAAALPTLTAHAPGWAHRIAAHGDLATNLVKFCSTRL